MSFVSASLVVSVLAIYSFLLLKRLRGPHPAAKPYTPPPEGSPQVNTHYDNVDMLKAIPNKPTQAGYAIIGGGFLGTYIIKLLIMRGESNIRIIDLHPPHDSVASHPSVSFIRADITSLPSIREALIHPFATTASPPSVIYYTAACIRFWERASYCWSPSFEVNVRGAEHVLTVTRELPSALLIYTSTADTVIPSTKFMRLGLDYRSAPYNTVTISDFDPPLSQSQLSQSCYSRSKMIAERLVIDTDGQAGIRTGIIRPGFTIIGPNDRLLTSTLTMSSVPIWDKLWSATNICVWDAAAAHILLEDALRRIPEEVGGQAFLVTGNGPTWKLEDTRNAVKYYSGRPLNFQEVNPLLIFAIAHLVELFLFLRYHFLLLLFSVFRSNFKPSLDPGWMGQLIYLQPSTLEYMSDVLIDDSRARKILGYHPQWETSQVIKYTVEEVNSGRAGGRGHGLQLRT